MLEENRRFCILSHSQLLVEVSRLNREGNSSWRSRAPDKALIKELIHETAPSANQHNTKPATIHQSQFQRVA